MVFLDESSFNTSMMRAYARSHSSERAVDFTPRNQGINQTLISAMQISGKSDSFILEGSMTADVFVWYVENILCPLLKPGQVVFFDNLSAHHNDEAIGLIEDCGCSVIFLPRYSPDLNPIEMLFSKIKALVRAGRWRELEQLWIAIGKALDAVSISDIAGWFKAAHPSLSL